MIGQKIRIYPTNEQKVILDEMFDFAKHSYNMLLNKWKEQYELYKENNRYKKPSVYFVRDWYKKNKEEQYQHLSNMIIETEAEHLGSAFEIFFKNKKGYPKYKKYKNSFSLNAKNQYICSVSNGKVKINKKLKIKISEDYKYNNPKNFTISKYHDEYYISICFDDNSKKDIFKKTNNTCGLDLGLKTNIVLYDSNNEVKKYNQNKEQNQRYDSAIKKYDKQLSKKDPNSKSYRKTLRKKSDRIKNHYNRNNDFYNKVVLDIVKSYDVIGIEDLNIKGLSKNKRQSKSWNKAALGRFITKLQNKAKMHDKKVIIVDRFFPSSQLCPCCGQRHSMPLYKRTFICECGYIKDRDENAAINIFQESNKIYMSQKG